MLSIKRTGNRLTVCFEGEIDHYAAETMRSRIETALKDKDINSLIMDFSGVTFMDSSGVGMIIGRYKTMQARGGKVCAEGLHPPVDRLFHIAGLHRIIDTGEQKGGNEG